METGEDLLGRARAGDKDALSDLLRQHKPVLRRKLEGRIPQCWQAVLTVDDVIQQTFTDIFGEIGRFLPRGPGSFVAWLTSVARCNLSDAIRMLETDKRGNNHRRLAPGRGNESMMALHELVGVTRTTPSRIEATREAEQVVKKALEQLPDYYRQVVQLYHLDGHSAADVGRLMNRNAGTILMAWQRALRRLRRLMGSDSKYFSKK
jgi:RNA polymerase sigma-70 factor (subfamily 1)